MEYIGFLKKIGEDCTGCESCKNVCSRKAIIMEEDKEGFLYPRIDVNRCIGCGKCETVCPFIHNNNLEKDKEPKAYAFYNKNIKERMDSSSGGIFTLLAKYVFSKKGIVFGAAFDESWDVHHVSIECVDDLVLLRGSKYVQSQIGDIYKQVRFELHRGRAVLFSGTPCQIEGLHAFLGYQDKNLILVDLICHGVPSPLVWREYLKLRRFGGNADIKKINFRSKNITWEKFFLEIIYQNLNKYSVSLDNDLYLRGFLQNLYLRPSCYNCHFKKKHHVSDFTIADFWGVDKILPKMNDHKGTSLVLLHTQKAEQIFEEIEGEKEKVIFESAIKMNGAMLYSPKKNLKRDAFFKELEQNPEHLEDILKKFTNHSFMEKIYARSKQVMKKLYVILFATYAYLCREWI